MLVLVGLLLIPGRQPTQVVQPGEVSLQDQALPARPGTVGCLRRAITGLAPRVQSSPRYLSVVIAADCQRTVGTLPGAALAQRRRGLLGHTKPSVRSMACGHLA
jgi:hypothetical protein